jgi:hypothetical protein
MPIIANDNIFSIGGNFDNCLILHLLRKSKNNIDLNFEFHQIHDKQYEEIEIFHKSKTLILKTYIYESDQKSRVNRFSLCVLGRSTFDDKCNLSFPSDYLAIDVHATDANIIKFVKKLKTPEDLKSYYHRIKDRILKNFLQKYNEIEQYYFQVIKNYCIADFLPLAKTQCDKCGYFRIEMDRSNYYLSNNKCPICYEKGYHEVNAKVEG